MRLASSYLSAKTPDLLKLASKDQTRPVLAALFLDVEAGMVVGTDSYKLAAVPVDVHPDDVSGLIPAEAIKAWQAACKSWRGANQHGPELVCAEGTVTLEWQGAVQTWPRPNGQYPDYARLMPAERSQFKIKLSAKLLLELAQGLGTEEVTLSFALQPDKTEGDDTGYHPANLKPITVSNGGHGEQAILMPIRLAQ